MDYKPVNLGDCGAFMAHNTTPVKSDTNEKYELLTKEQKKLSIFC